MNNINKLNLKWQQCWQDRSIDKSTVILSNQQQIDRIFQTLISAYTEPHRHYHNLNHISQILTITERLNAQIENSTAVSLAVWFHDFVYDPQCSDNEFQSAKFADKLLTDAGTSILIIDRVHQLILATQGHQIDPDDRDRCIFLDADLAILGTDPSQYQVYQRSIRREYSWVSDDAYKLGRIRVLETFLQRDRLYYTDQLFDQLESRARLNLSQEIDLLSTT